jgi:hypothetical protein
MDEIEQRFDRYFATLDQGNPLADASILNLYADEPAEVKLLAPALAEIRAEINQRFETNATEIVTPDGSVRIHMDYIASAKINAFAFFFEDWHFIGITRGMLELFINSCTALWRLNALEDLLGVDLDTVRRDTLFQFVLLLQLQYISNHELGHMFHGHCPALRTGQYRSELSVTTLLANSKGMEEQAHELEADGYAINLILRNLLEGQNGNFMHDRLKSRMLERKFVVTLFILSIGSLLYFFEPAPFDSAKVRSHTHTEGLIRMNILLGEILGWCKENLRWENAITLDECQRIMSLVAIAASDSTQETVWKAQGEFLNTPDGRAYLNELYERRRNLRTKMEPNHWRLVSELPHPHQDVNPG